MIPFGSLSLSQEGATLYGMTFSGGPANRGGLFSLPFSAVFSGNVTLSYLHFFPAGFAYGAGANEALPVFADGSTLYSITKNGGPSNNGTLFSIPPSGGSPSYLHSFSGGSGDGAMSCGDLTFSNDGATLYDVTSSGGPTGNGSIFRLPASGGSLTYLHFVSGGVGDGAFPVGELTLSKDGSTLYSFTLQGGGSQFGLCF